MAKWPWRLSSPFYVLAAFVLFVVKKSDSPAIVAIRDASNTATLAKPVSELSPKARFEMKMDMVNPMPASRPAPTM